MKLRHFLVLLVACGCATAIRAEAPETLTLKLIRAYDAAWDRGDWKAMYGMLDPECVFESPFQTRLGRDEIRDHVFENTKKFRDTVGVEDTSKIDGDIAYSFGSQTFNQYAPDGTIKSRRSAKLLFIFTRRPGQDWKIRFQIITEEAKLK